MLWIARKLKGAMRGTKRQFKRLIRASRRGEKPSIEVWNTRRSEEKIGNGPGVMPSVRSGRIAPLEHQFVLAKRLLSLFDNHGIYAFALPTPARINNRIVALGMKEREQTLPRVFAEMDQVDGLYIRQPGGKWRRPGDYQHADAPRLEIMHRVHGDGFLFGENLRITVELWDFDEAQSAWLATTRNRYLDRIAETDLRLSRLSTPFGSIKTHHSLVKPSITDVDFPIDVVYTWVDGEDEKWQAKRAKALGIADVANFTEKAASDARYHQHDELRFSLRSIESYAPWVNNVYIVTDAQIPDWVDVNNPRLKIVDHKDIWDDETQLPSFNSHAIEAHLHKIPGLSEHFLYLNDDFFFGNYCPPEVFFDANGLQKMFLSRSLIGVEPAEPGEIASESALKNARQLLHEFVDRDVRQKFYHAPYSLTQSVARDIEERFKELVYETKKAPFRQVDDLTLAGSFHLYFAYVTGRATVGNIDYGYVDIESPDVEEQYKRLMRHRFQVFCLNESGSGALPIVLADQKLRHFLEEYFPNKSTFEI